MRRSPAVGARRTLGAELTGTTRHWRRGAGVVFAAFLLTILTSSTAWAGPFTILNIEYEIWLRMGLEEYHETSTSPLFARLTDTQSPGWNGGYSYGEAFAIGASVGVEVYQDYRVDDVHTPFVNGTATSTITFASNLDGEAPEVLFSLQNALYNDFRVTITDLTTSAPLFSWSCVSVAPCSAPTWSYAAWDSTHTYQLQLSVQNDTDYGNYVAAEYLTTSMFAVPDLPATAPLLAFGFAVIASLRRRLR